MTEEQSNEGEKKPKAEKKAPKNLVRLVNLTGVAYPIVLDHPVFRDKKYGFTVGTAPRIVESRDGTRSKEQVRRALPGSITLPAGGSVGGLHPAIEKVTQVAALIARRAARVVPEDSEPAPAKEPEKSGAQLEGSAPPVASSGGRSRRARAQGPQGD